MNKITLPKISVIVPVRPGDKLKAALLALRQVDYPPQLLEVFVSLGTNPSRQRNQAVRQAQGEYLYFLDNDSRLENQALRRSVATFSGEIKNVRVPHTRGFFLFPRPISKLIIDRFFSGKIYHGVIGAVGGPSVWWEKETFWSLISGAILESFFTYFLMAARFRSIGSIHRASEKELILCNLSIKKDIFEEVGGFEECLYPNEENELLNRIEKAGYQIVYHPGILVFRPRRESLKSLFTAFFHYGRGRMEEIRVEGPGLNILFLTPFLFLIYLVVLLFYHPWFAFLPLGLYYALAFSSSLGFAVRKGRLYLITIVPFVYLLAHLSYALGFIYGRFTNLEKRKKIAHKQKLTVVRLKRFDQPWNEMTEGKDIGLL